MLRLPHEVLHTVKHRRWWVSPFFLVEEKSINPFSSLISSWLVHASLTWNSFSESKIGGIRMVSFPGLKRLLHREPHLWTPKKNARSRKRGPTTMSSCYRRDILFYKKKGGDPSSLVFKSLYNFVTKSQHVQNLTQTQFSEKFQRLRRKYENNAMKEQVQPHVAPWL